MTLLALGVFTIVVTGVFQTVQPDASLNRTSGTGGFHVWAESTIPVKDPLGEIHEFMTTLNASTEGFRLVPMPIVGNDDASCLNLNQVPAPALLGVPAGLFDSLQAFGFNAAAPSVDPRHRWKSLDITQGDDVMYGIADQSVITWGIRKSLGDTIKYRDESGRELRVVLSAALENSIFQGFILVSDSLLRLHYPSVGGARILLAEAPASIRDTLPGILENRFADYGLMAVPASMRLASFNRVQNTYLGVFMVLGGLGILLGTIGLGIIVIRNLAARRREFSLYSAVGLNRKFIHRLLITEQIILVTGGILKGLVASVPVILGVPGSGQTSNWPLLAGILLLVWLSSLAWTLLPARLLTNRMNFLLELREE